MIKDLKYAQYPFMWWQNNGTLPFINSWVFFLIWIVSEYDNYCIKAALSTSYFNDIIHSQRGRWGEAVIIKLHTQCCYFVLSPDGSWPTTGCLDHVKRKAIQTSGNEWEIMQLFWSKILSTTCVLCRSS